MRAHANSRQSLVLPTFSRLSLYQASWPGAENDIAMDNFDKELTTKQHQQSKFSWRANHPRCNPRLQSSGISQDLFLLRGGSNLKPATIQNRKGLIDFQVNWRFI